jgi:hypothetical protein
MSLAPWLIPLACVVCLIWPAIWNGYPLVFADTGTYLSQAMHRYIGWDRPVFYSVFMFPLHLGISTWPVVVTQSALAVFVLDQTRRAFDLSLWWLGVLGLFLAGATWFPWIVSELMPDLFTPLSVLSLVLLVFFPSRLWPLQRMAFIALTAFMIATQQSSVPLALGLLAFLIPLRWIAARSRVGPETAMDDVRPSRLLEPLLAPGLAMASLMLVNAIAFGAVSLSPYGNVFLLARLIYDGPGMDVLRRDCPEQHWRLCPWLDAFPPSSDDFLWRPDSPIMRAGGHKAVSADADAIIRATMAAAPGELLTAAVDNTLMQLIRFDSGDGLQPWPAQVSPWIDQDFPPREAAAYHASLEQIGTTEMPPPVLAAIHWYVASAGVVVALMLLPIAWRRRHGAAWFLAATLMTLPLSAAITGGLSTPHERYQSRIMWLPAAMALLTVPAVPRRRGG